MAYNKKDHFHRKAKEEGFLARSAYKLQEIDKKFDLLESGMTVFDLGCAPGAWVQVALSKLGPKGRVVGVDLDPIDPSLEKFEQLRFIQGDAFQLSFANLPEAPFDVVLSDMAPKTSGIKVRDQARSAELCLRALELADVFLKEGGSMVVKLFEGEDAKSVRAQFESKFQQVKLFRPTSTRSASAEIYMVGLKKKPKQKHT